MATFTIRAVHDCQHRDSKRLLQSLRHAGSYFLTHARWGCEEGDHSACLEVEAETEDEVRLMVPPVLRSCVTITRGGEDAAGAITAAGSRAAGL